MSSPIMTVSGCFFAIHSIALLIAWHMFNFDVAMLEDLTLIYLRLNGLSTGFRLYLQGQMNHDSFMKESQNW